MTVPAPASSPGATSAPGVPVLGPTRDALHRLAVHVLSPVRRRATGRIGLRPTLGGFGTPPVAIDGRAVQVRVEHAVLVVDTDGEVRALDLRDGVSLARAADHVGVKIDVDGAAGLDGPAPGDPDAPLAVDPTAADVLAGWWALGAAVLSATGRAHVAAHPDQPPSSAVQLWPEHFDLATDLGDETRRTRANVGFSPGDGFSDEPYLYVGPWATEVVAGRAGWDAPFGAVCPRSSIVAAPSPVDAALAFVRSRLDDLDRLAGPSSGTA